MRQDSLEAFFRSGDDAFAVKPRFSRTLRSADAETDPSGKPARRPMTESRFRDDLSQLLDGDIRNTRWVRLQRRASSKPQSE